jgi:hypothetical protein
LDLAQVVVKPAFSQTLKRWKIGNNLSAQAKLDHTARQAFEEVRHCIDGIELVFLIGVKLKFQRHIKSP